jgi:hypothetical protein
VIDFHLDPHHRPAGPMDGHARRSHGD